MAKAFPNSQLVGYDIVEAVIGFAKSQAISEGVSDRASFKKLDSYEGLPEEKYYDLITTSDVIHDMADHHAALKAIHNALEDDGTYLWLEINSKYELQDNFGTMEALLYSWSVVYCMTTSLAEKSKGLGTLGMPQSKVKNYFKEAGCSHVQKMPVDNSFYLNQNIEN